MPSTFAETVIDFESFPLGPESYFNGPTGNATAEETHYWWGSQTEQVGTFMVDEIQLSNRSSAFSWGGFAISNVTDNTTPGFSNQYSAYPGSGAGGSQNYAVAFGNRDVETTRFIDENFVFDRNNVDHLKQLPSIYLPENASAHSVAVTNTTYGYLSMRDGDAFAKKFGGIDGTDSDYLTLSIYGLDETDSTLDASIEFNLADFRFASESEDYILGDWAQLDLSPLADARSLHFNLSSSDIGDDGMNTPAYFAIDNFQITAIPEPSAAVAIAGLCVAGTLRRRKRRNPA
ncbi:DUF4465 domain-containing protein [Roseiconus lacunae]|uniref:DUF4465 domain-containing protein n=1 Tax=Roseiconus lacunae TaxID=2605694 RepID=UPI001E301CBB|nr:DUF4465 domain-containing protein [Roseiconus lacunae]MCD0459173.1 DUF4465 domain-containing protein [Roseiconus lacunae]